MRRSRWPTASTDADFNPYLAGWPDASVDMFRRFIALARSCGPLTLELQTTVIVLCGTHRIFASVRVTKTGLRGFANLARQLTDRRRIAVRRQGGDDDDP